MRGSSSSPGLGFVGIYLPNLDAEKTNQLVSTSPFGKPSKPKARRRRHEHGGDGARAAALGSSASAPLLHRGHGAKGLRRELDVGALPALPESMRSPAAAAAAAATSSSLGPSSPSRALPRMRPGVQLAPLPEIVGGGGGGSSGAAPRAWEGGTPPGARHGHGAAAPPSDALAIDEFRAAHSPVFGQAGLLPRRFSGGGHAGRSPPAAAAPAPMTDGADVVCGGGGRGKRTKRSSGHRAGEGVVARGAETLLPHRHQLEVKWGPGGGVAGGDGDDNAEAVDGDGEGGGRAARSALEEISAISRSVVGNLDGLIRRCGELKTTSGDDGEGDEAASKQLQRMLYEASYGDPVYVRAREVANESSTAAASVLGDEESSSFKAIADVTRQVHEAMASIQGSSWASSVLLSVPKEEPEPAVQPTVVVAGAGAAEGRPAFSRATSVGSQASASALADQSADAASGSGETKKEGEDRALARGRTVALGGGGNLLKPPPLEGSGRLRKSSRTTTLSRSPSRTPNRSPKGSTQPLNIAKLQGAFRRFKVPDSGDLHMQDVPELLRFLGHVMTDEEHVRPLIAEVTPYEYLDFEEFVTFLEKFTPYEIEQFKVVFDKFDADGSGEISAQELKPLLTALSYMPMKNMLQEALRCVDVDGNGQLSFDELVTFLKAYRQAEGFTTDEVEQLLASFTRFASNKKGHGDMIPAKDLPDAMVSVFGCHVMAFISNLASRLASGQGLQKCSPSPGATSGKMQGEMLSFSEFLIIARKVRESVYDDLAQEYPSWAPGGRGEAQSSQEKKEAAFEAVDFDNSGGISEVELRAAVERLGFTPLRQNILEVVAEVIEDIWQNGRELDFDEFFAFMLIVRQREGFSKESVEDMRLVFNRFDDDGSGEVDDFELAELFRHLGYKVEMDDIHVYVTEVDVNKSGQLDFREFIRLMRLWREKEIEKYRAVFGSYKEIVGHVDGDMQAREGPASSGVVCHIPRSKVLGAIKDLGLVPTKTLRAVQEQGLPQQGLNFDSFVAVVDSCRREMVENKRKHAGFNEAQVQRFQDMFNTIDKDRSGEIDTKELGQLLRIFKWEPKTQQEQAGLMKKLDMARARAREAGIQDVGKDGCSKMKFWSFVQLARILETEHDAMEEERLKDLVQELKFEQAEVDQFRQIFCERKRTVPDDEDSSPTSKKAQVEDPGGLSREAVRKLMRSLVTTIPPAEKVKLDDKLKGLMVKDLLDFQNFLRLMRWLLDTNFAGLNSRLAVRVSGGAGGLALA